MPELHDLLERRAGDYQPPADLLVRVRERSRQRHRTRRVASAVAAVALVAVAAGGVFRVLQRPDTIFVDPPPNPVIGTWESIDSDGSFQTMEITFVDGVGYEVVIDDDGASVCDGAPSTMTGTGQLNEVGLVIAAPVLECEDGTTPAPVDGSSLEEALRDFTLVHDTETGTLGDNVGVTWYRPGAGPDTAPNEGSFEAIWPQSSLDEVREAQERADAGDPDYTWQVDAALNAERGLGNAEIVSRYLTEEQGWERFRPTGSPDDEIGLGAGDDVDSYAITFVRCAVGESNPLYPDVPKGRSCAPTIDEVTYETLKVAIYQPLDTGPNGIWVVRSSPPVSRVRQAVPPSGAEVADLVETFGQARVSGEGAEKHVEPAAEVPQLYQTSTGAPYERFEYDSRTTWPTGVVDVHVRLIAGGGDTVVEQDFVLEPGRQTLEYYQGGTTENGAEVGRRYSVLDGQVTFSVPAAPRTDPASWQSLCCFTPGGEDMTGVQGYLSDFSNELTVVVDPLPPATQCGVGDEPVPAEELVRSVRSNPKLRVSERAARVGGTDAVRLDVALRDPESTCSQDPEFEGEGAPFLAPRPGPGQEPMWYDVTSDKSARLYVFVLPSDPERTVAIVIRGPKSTFDQLLEGAQPILESFELNAD